MKRFNLVAVCGSFVVMILLSSSPSAFAQDKQEKKLLLKVQIAHPTSLTVVGDCLPWFCNKVEKITNGSVKFKIYEPGELVPAMEIHDAVSKGSIDAGLVPSGFVAGKVRAASLFTSVPFGPDPVSTLSWFHHGNGWKLYQEAFDKAGYHLKVFPFGFAGAETAGWFTKEIKTVSDLKGLKVRFFGLGGNVMQKLGASVIMVPGPEIFSALEKGAIDGTEYSQPSIDTQLGFYKVAKYNYFPGWHQPSGVLGLVVNKNVWNSMSEYQQTAFELAVMATNTYTLAHIEGIQSAIIIENAEKHGVKNLYWPPEILDALKKAWLEVAEEESNKDAMFKKTWEDLKTWMGTTYGVWESYGYLPRRPPPPQE